MTRLMIIRLVSSPWASFPALFIKRRSTGILSLPKTARSSLSTARISAITDSPAALSSESLPPSGVTGDVASAPDASRFSLATWVWITEGLRGGPAATICSVGAGPGAPKSVLGILMTIADAVGGGTGVCTGAAPPLFCCFLNRTKKDLVVCKMISEQ